MKERTTTQQRVDWLLKHPKLWKGYGGHPHVDVALRIESDIFNGMQRDGLLSKRTSVLDCAFWRWINEARKQRREGKSKEQPK